VVIFWLAAVAFPAEAGGWAWAHGDRDPGWIVVVAMSGLLTVAFAAVGWRGHGIELTPGGIHADRVTGTLVIPWTALSPGQPRPVTPPTRYCLDLILARPEEVSRRGPIWNRRRITFEGTQPAFVVAVIRHYAVYPANRAMIGTQAEHRRLVELLAAPPAPPQPPPSRRRVVALAAAGVLLFVAAVTAETWIDEAFGSHSVLGYAFLLIRQILALFSFHLFAAAIGGIRARRRPEAQDATPVPPQPASPAASRPSWARDVTNEHTR